MITIVSRTRRLIVFGLTLLLAACGPSSAPVTPTPSSTDTSTPTATASPTITPTPSPTPDGSIALGESVQGRPIRLYRFGNGPLKLLVIGGIHGGYEGNTVALARALIDHYRANPSAVDGMTILIVPEANPDAVAAFEADGGWLAADKPAEPFERWRTNAHGVDLNRNWDCDWQPSGEWSGGAISGGSAPFSEPETRILRDLVLSEKPDVVLFLHSALGAILAGGCGDFSAFDPGKRLAQVYAEAAGYVRPVDKGSPSGFTAYPITGDASNWVSGQGIPSLTVELSSHASPELDQNLAGISALAAYIASRPWVLPRH